MIRLLEEHFYADLPEDLLEQTIKSEDHLIENLIAWGKSYLKKGGLVHYPQRGYVQITEKGKSGKENPLSCMQNAQISQHSFTVLSMSDVNPDVQQETIYRLGERCDIGTVDLLTSHFQSSCACCVSSQRSWRHSQE